MQFLDPVIGVAGEVHSVQKNPLGMEARGDDGNLYVYGQGCASTVLGSVATISTAGLTALIAADAKGPVCVATAATIANTFGWYVRDTGVVGSATVMVAASSAASGNVGFETTAGNVGDGRAAGDKIVGFYSCPANAGGAAAAVAGARFSRPYVDDSTGS